MKILTNVRDIQQRAMDDCYSGYTAELLVQDLNELIALRAQLAEAEKVIENFTFFYDLTNIEKVRAFKLASQWLGYYRNGGK